MARDIVNKTRIVGFAEQIIDSAGADQVIDLKHEFGPIFEEFMRSNKRLSLMEYVWGDQARTVYKTAYKAIKDNVADFNYALRNSGVTVKPEEEVILMQETKDVAASFYAKDFEQSNALQTVAKRIIAELFITPDEIIDDAANDAYAAAAEANTLLPLASYDFDSLEMTAANGEIVYGLLADLAETFKATAVANTYHRGSKFRNDEISFVVSTKVDELLTMFKAGYIDQSGLLNAGVFGDRFRNIKIEVMEEMPITSTGQPVHIEVHTDRAVQATVELSRHFKLIDEAINQTGYTTDANNVFGWGFKTVFDNEVAAIAQTAPVVKTAVKTQLADVKAGFAKVRAEMNKMLIAFRTAEKQLNESGSDVAEVTIEKDSEEDTE